MTPQDIVIGALCAWRENRGGGRTGMQSVLNVLRNRAAARGTSIYEEAVRPWQFSSMTAKGDPQLPTWPPVNDAAFATALLLARESALGDLPDITGGATSYFAASMAEPPSWASSMEPTAEIAGQKFYRTPA